VTRAEGCATGLTDLELAFHMIAKSTS